MGIPISLFDKYFTSNDLSLYMAYDKIHKRLHDFDKYHAALISYVISLVNGNESSKFEDFILQDSVRDDIGSDSSQDPKLMLDNFKRITGLYSN